MQCDLMMAKGGQLSSSLRREPRNSPRHLHGQSPPTVTWNKCLPYAATDRVITTLTYHTNAPQLPSTLHTGTSSDGLMAYKPTT